LTKGREILEGFRAERPNRAGSEFYHVNIAEGFERGGNQEFSQFLYIPKVRVKYSQIYVAVDQRYVAHERRRPAQKIVQTLVEYDQQSDYVSEKERNEGREIQKICVTQAFNLTKRSKTIEAADVG
jgi:hypothetical protein